MSVSTFPDTSLPRDSQSPDFDLIIRQQPSRARVAGGKEKGTLTPPGSPALGSFPADDQDVDRWTGFTLQNESQLTRPRLCKSGHYLQSPYYFMCCSLYDAQEDAPAPVSPSTALTGTLVSSLHRLKDVDNTDGGFFVWGDLSIKVEGEYRLKFTLFEMRKDAVAYLKTIISDRFTGKFNASISWTLQELTLSQVSPPKSFPGMAESTFLSRSFADQGVKLRIRKEPRTLIKRPAPRPEDFTQALPPRSPERSSMQMAGNNFPGYQTAGREYTYYGGPVKRQRTSVDFGTRGMYESDGRMRQMDAYPQTAAMYNQAGGYPASMMPGYPTGHTGVPDYAMSYGIPSSAQVSQMQDPGSQSRSSQQATMQSLGMVNAPGTPTPDSTGAMMPGYPRSQYSSSSTILPPLQRGRTFTQGSNGASARGYFDQPSQAATPILPSQAIGTNEADRYGTTGSQTSYDHPGSANGTPR
ncbi:hypothetical protein ARAM_004139 [Aspergillus rambellii]|uniref:Velvet domain-containing protein n=1 Tax=Aspergillus rambellii TaxID=308745 RepID=A0A0F8UIR3_9EURO|nr:hypothetical protein ARAM_004139 [Aspergillus rambellii]